MGFGRLELLVLVLTLLAGVGVAWFARTGRWRQRRLLPITLAVLVAYVVLARRLGWGELVVIAVLVVPLLFLPVRLMGGGKGSP